MKERLDCEQRVTLWVPDCCKTDHVHVPYVFIRSCSIAHHSQHAE